MPHKPSKRSVLRVLALCLSAAACTQPSWQASPQPVSTALMRVDRASVMATACFYDRQPVPCGDYLLQRLVPMLDNRPQIRDLVISDATARCRAEGVGTLCEVSARVRFTQGGRTWPVRVDMRYRALRAQPARRFVLRAARPGARRARPPGRLDRAGERARDADHVAVGSGSRSLF